MIRKNFWCMNSARNNLIPSHKAFLLFFQAETHLQENIAAFDAPKLRLCYKVAEPSRCEPVTVIYFIGSIQVQQAQKITVKARVQFRKKYRLVYGFLLNPDKYVIYI